LPLQTAPRDWTGKLHLGVEVICRYDDSAGGRKSFQDVFIAAALERAVGSIYEGARWGEKAQEEGAWAWCLRMQLLARDWRDGGDSVYRTRMLPLSLCHRCWSWHASGATGPVPSFFSLHIDSPGPGLAPHGLTTRPGRRVSTSLVFSPTCLFRRFSISCRIE
jgi:hypothetical protein